jgi:CubicO group peptidase (beta-lactamase class C family)
LEVVDPSSLVVGWPGEPAVAVSRWRDGAWHTLATHGDLDEVRPWASVSKMVTALSAAIDVEAGRVRLDHEVRAGGVTLAHLLAHASGLGLERDDAVLAPGTKRIYSNYGIDLAAAHLADGLDLATWVRARVTAALSMTTTRLVGRAAEGLVGSTRDLRAFAHEWVSPTLISASRRDATVTPFLGELAGIVPGFGRFDPCPWGLGVEVRGSKHHWMGDWPAASFGHFGRSGALVLVNVVEGLCVVATSSQPFAAWARDLWPRWTSDVRQFAGVS